MKKLLLSAILLATTLLSAQETVTISMGTGYENDVYFNLSDQTENTYEAASWDIAFLRENAQSIGIRVNDGIGIQVFEAANNASDFDAIDVSNEANWTPLFNDDTNWDNGAFMQGSATYGWGEYNPVSHHVEGTIVFVLKYTDGTYIKFINEDYFGGYTFKYATWNGTDWVNETTETVSNANNPETRYNYYSLQNNEEVIAEPAVDAWDFVFTKYNTYLDPPGANYIVTGALHNPGVTVAQNEEPSGEGDPNAQEYSEEINTIGYDWKSFNGTGYDVNSDMAYYIKHSENTIYRVTFTNFEGSSTGNITFDMEDVSDILGIENVTNEVSFGMYPNPSQNKKVNIVYDINTFNTAENKIEIYDSNGRNVFSTYVSQSEGFYNKQLDLTPLQNGIYFVAFTNGDNRTTKKLILN
ncbi:T9SS type A sorting domain-containing protein [Cochleicola gelatinilyticus]|uniref:Secretion system C-terminal sorting domain-containing protein n=1 Tax=Cochleicola gelatinilyticus TaxID=1763537 RepID=A0A167IP49_9FLAO|nr:T9SS type A sorting domain-containing protein [Cochleicola gelatinilyticus]OAB79866.1 hypothetical protein ULVI_03765 [Cochleicola gelatinilyticus]